MKFKIYILTTLFTLIITTSFCNSIDDIQSVQVDTNQVKGTFEAIEVYINEYGQRIDEDGNIVAVVSKENNQYYIDQLEDYSKVLNEINQELGTNYNFNFESATFEEAEKSVDMYKSMSLDEFRNYMTNSIKEAEKMCNNVK